MKKKNIDQKMGTNTLLSSTMETILKKKGKYDRFQRTHLHADSRRSTTLRSLPFQKDAQVVEKGTPDHAGRLAKDHAAVNPAARFLDNQHLQQISLVNIPDAYKYYTWLRQRTATHHFALMTDVGVRPVNTNAQILDLFTGKGR